MFPSFNITLMPDMATLQKSNGDFRCTITSLHPVIATYVPWPDIIQRNTCTCMIKFSEAKGCWISIPWNKWLKAYISDVCTCGEAVENRRSACNHYLKRKNNTAIRFAPENYRCLYLELRPRPNDTSHVIKAHKLLMHRNRNAIEKKKK